MSMSKENFKFPRSLLQQINECSNGGFVLFNFNSTGNPEVYFHSDSDLHTIALLSHAENYVQAAKASHQQICLDSIEGSEIMGDIEDFDDDDDVESWRKDNEDPEE